MESIGTSWRSMAMVPKLLPISACTLNTFFFFFFFFFFFWYEQHELHLRGVLQLASSNVRIPFFLLKIQQLKVSPVGERTCPIPR